MVTEVLDQQEFITPGGKGTIDELFRIFVEKGGKVRLPLVIDGERINCILQIKEGKQVLLDESTGQEISSEQSDNLEEN
jgi:hypothetical protein